MKCNNCGSRSIEIDYTKGNSFCIDCGYVAEEDHVVAEVTFDNTKVVGTFISDNQSGPSFLKNRHGNYICDSRQYRLNKAYQEIQSIAEKLTINQHIIDMAKRCFSLAADKKFIQGRKTKLIVGVILYSLCRQNRTMHLLIDFCEVLQTNLYVLGSLYLKLIKLLHLSIPQIDPSLFIQRYCNKLKSKFGSNTNQIASTALKILQSMKRNWLHMGRRPSGLCGASILIAAKCHEVVGINIADVVNVVNLCDETVKKRIIEFSNTPVANNLTLNSLNEININNSNNASQAIDNYLDSLNANIGMDPPSYIKNRLKDKQVYSKDVLLKTREIENFLIDRLSCREMNINQPIKISFYKTNEDINRKYYVLDDLKYDYKDVKPALELNDKTICYNTRSKRAISLSINSNSTANKVTNKDNDRVTKSSNSIKKSNITDSDKSINNQSEIFDNTNKSYKNTKQINKSRKNTGLITLEEKSKELYNEEILSDLGSEEADDYIHSKDEYSLKKKIWEVIFEDWIKEQEFKDKIYNTRSKRNKSFLSENNKTNNNEKKESISNPIDIIKNSGKFSKKIDFNKISKIIN